MRTIAFAVVSSSWFLLGGARAEEPVYFPDPRLKAAVEETLWTWDPTPSDMLALTELTCIGSRPREDAIEDLTGLEYATNLQTLTIRYHLVSDLSALSGLTNLQTLVLQANTISDISALSGLVNLETLDLERNQVSDISAVSGLSRLHTLSFHRNAVSDISPLSGLTSLKWFDLRINPLNQEAYDTYIAQIKANNPGLWFSYDPFYHRRLVIESTRGGSVTSPGEGGFAYEYGTTLWLMAQADPCFVFAGWTGTYSSSQNPLFFTMDQDYSIVAHFRSALKDIYVDDDAPDDPGPRDSSTSDPHEDGTADHPFDRIQQAIDVAGDGASITVRPGTYHESINLLGKRIRLTGTDRNVPNGAAYPLIDGYGTGPVVSFAAGEDASCTLTGFVIAHGRGRTVAAIACSSSSPTIANCLIVGNRSTDPNGAAICCTDSNATFANCTIADNYGGEHGAGLLLVNSNVVLTNSILSGNAPNEMLLRGASEPSIIYSNMAGGWADRGNIDADPAFARRGHWANPDHPGVVAAPDDLGGVWIDGDYHLKSQAGRWDPATRTWVQDMVTSPCIDAGDPASPVGHEPVPHGEIINMGAYGGTAQAGKSAGPP